MTTLKKIISQVNFDDVWECMKRHYEIKKKNSHSNFKNLYEKLLEITPSINSTNMYIYINAFKESEDGDNYCISNFSEDDSTLYFDLSGKDDNHCGYSLVGNCFEEWLSFYIDDDTLKNFTNVNIIAHCLWEMTFFGFEQKREEDGMLIIN